MFSRIGIFFIFALSLCSMAGEDQSLEKTNAIHSSITFFLEDQFMVNYASISKNDPLISCPLNDLPSDLLGAIEQIKLKASEIVSKVDKSRDSKCIELQNKITDYSSQIKTAIYNQFLIMNSASSQSNQVSINYQTQQANAIGSLLVLASDMVVLKCHGQVDDRVVIQKMIGQLTMLSGLFMGGWEGISLAATGEIFANLPLFGDDVAASQCRIQEFDEKNLRGDFLCFFRQMLKVSVLLFIGKDTDYVNGLDLQFRHGPVRKTIQSIEKFKKTQPNDFADMVLVDTINQNSNTIFANLEKWDKKSDNSLPLYSDLIEWCENNYNLIASSPPGAVSFCSLKDFSDPGDNIRNNVSWSINRLGTICSEIKTLNWRTFRRENIPEVIDDAYWQFKTIRMYHKILMDDQNSRLGHILRTLFSKSYFDRLKRSVEVYKEDSGSQVRLNFFNLVNGLALQMAKKSFKALMRENHSVLTGHRILRYKTIKSIEIKRRAVLAMLDLCQTIDPTLAKFIIEAPHKQSLFGKWEKYCVGPKSRLCKPVLKSPHKKYFLDNKRYREYFYSLCTGKYEEE